MSREFEKKCLVIALKHSDHGKEIVENSFRERLVIDLCQESTQSFSRLVEAVCMAKEGGDSSEILTQKFLELGPVLDSDVVKENFPRDARTPRKIREHIRQRFDLYVRMLSDQELLREILVRAVVALKSDIKSKAMGVLELSEEDLLSSEVPESVGAEETEEEVIDPKLPNKIRKLFLSEELLFLQVLKDESGDPAWYTDRNIMKFIEEEEAYDAFIAREENDADIEKYCAWYRENGFPNLRYVISEKGRCLTQVELTISLDGDESDSEDSGEGEMVEDESEEEREPTPEELKEEEVVENGKSSLAQVTRNVLLHMEPDVIYRKQDLFDVIPDNPRAEMSGGEETHRLTIGETFIPHKLPVLNRWLNENRKGKNGTCWNIERTEDRKYVLRAIKKKN